MATDTDISAMAPEGHVLKRWIWKLTIGQWLAIDAEYKRPEARIDWKSTALFFVVALGLTLQRYYGGRRFFRATFEDVVRSWTYPGIWKHLYWVGACTTVYFIIPALFIALVYKERIRDYGFSLKGTAKHSWIYLGLFMIVLPFVIAASTSSSFQHRYPFYHHAGNSWLELLLWEGAYGFQFVSLEFFFRGFMLFGLARYIGAYAIFAMVVPYCMIHFGKPFPETIGAIIAGTALGTLALRTRSIFGGIAIHMAVAWLMDILALWQKGKLQHLLGL